MSEPIEACKLLPGMLLARKYRLTCKIGQGAMGVVWAARNEATGREVALKLIARPDPALRKRLLREAQSCGALQHPNLVDVIDVARTEGGEPCLIMELLVGDSVAALLDARRRLDAPLSVRIARDVAGALAAAHAVGIVHRDLKPANVFLHRPPEASDFVVKVLDFGVAKNLAAAGGVTSTLHAVVGSPFYMSPEQLRAEASLDARSDLWSLGVMLFEMLTGVRPFQGEGTQLLSQILTGEIPKVSRYLRHVDERLVRIVDRCLRRAPEERFRSAEEVARELDGFVRGRASEPRGEGELRIPGARAALPSGVTAEQETAVAPVRGRGSGVSAAELATTVPLGPRDTPGMQNDGENAAAWQGARAVQGVQAAVQGAQAAQAAQAVQRPQAVQGVRAVQDARAAGQALQRGSAPGGGAGALVAGAGPMVTARGTVVMRGTDVEAQQRVAIAMRSAAQAQAPRAGVRGAEAQPAAQPAPRAQPATRVGTGGEPRRRRGAAKSVAVTIVVGLAVGALAAQWLIGWGTPRPAPAGPDGGSEPAVGASEATPREVELAATIATPATPAGGRTPPPPGSAAPGMEPTAEESVYEGFSRPPAPVVRSASTADRKPAAGAKRAAPPRPF
ncbi:uncharacterized protein SOCEGT47_014700 [Sorangium cellulosum]|uniref:Protein kinase domain-containing protein n=1 Tax=Sorangium cellulosum TaxID=56 RepID=A0A4V0ND05_SORCE|nr:serine/threonine-protein kinase [Sorangium cellulosum]AUX20992.1 uncharacterized protein SOCEGT47_014700 [Sorangium cellulosum]